MSFPLTSRAGDVAARFDRVSEVYDETREPLTKDEVDRLAGILRDRGLQKILEVGVGTGRIALPLQQRGFEMCGADLSSGMLQKARAKGLRNLLLGDANRLPFPQRTFDAIVLAHVIHLLDDPSQTFVKLARVARGYVVAIVTNRDRGVPPAEGDRTRLWELMREAAEAEGYHPPAEDWRRRFRREEEFITSSRPDDLLTIGDAEVVTTVGERLSALEKRAHGYPADIPDDVFARMMAKVKSSVDPKREIRYRRIVQVALWRVERF
jgi:SAM-dependent methyltransferase